MFYGGIEAMDRWNEFLADTYFNVLINLYFAPYAYLGKRDKMIDTFKSICRVWNTGKIILEVATNLL